MLAPAAEPDYGPPMKRTGTDSRGSAATRLVAAGVELAAAGGVKSVTTRAAAQAAGTSASAVTTALGGRQGLLCAIFEHGRVLAAGRDQSALSEASSGPLSAGLLGDWLAAYLQSEARHGRSVVLLRRELYLQVNRMPELLQIARAWREQDLAFCTQVLKRFGLPAEHAALLLEAVHALVELFPVSDGALMRTAWAHQAVRHFCARLTGAPPSGAPWRPLIEAEASAMASRRQDGVARAPQAELILKAAVTLLARVGAAGLSHRALAEEAGVPLAATTYHFANRDDILEGAFSRVYEALSREARDINLGQDTLSVSDLAQQSALITLDEEGELVESMMVIDELLAAAFRDPGLEPFALHLLSSRGQTTAMILPAIKGVRVDEWSREDAFLISLLGLSAVQSLRITPRRERAACARQSYEDRLRLLLRVN